MLHTFITSQKKTFEAPIYLEDSIEALLKPLLNLGLCSTSILLFIEENEENTLEAKAPIALFIFQDLPYAAYLLKENSLKTLRFSDYFKILSRTSGRLSLYPLSPVLFKSLLIMAEGDLVMRATSKVIDNQALMDWIEQDKKESVLTLKNPEQAALYYFREGKLRDGYFQHSDKTESSENLMKIFLSQIDLSRNNASDLALYEAARISGASDQDKAAKQIAAALPLKTSVWTKSEQARISNPPEQQRKKTHPEWGIEFLNGDKTGAIIKITQAYCSLGRGKTDLRLDDLRVSRHHADLEQSQGTLTLIDNQSTNGLFVNDEKVIKKALTKGDIIRLGDTSLKVVQQSSLASQSQDTPA